MVGASAHETKPALPLVEPAIARAQVALDAPVRQCMPIPAGEARDLLLHRAIDLDMQISLCRYIWSLGSRGATGGIA